MNALHTIEQEHELIEQIKSTFPANNLNMYIGFLIMLSGQFTTVKFAQLHKVFEIFFAIDREIFQLLGNDENFRTMKKRQFSFELFSVISLGILFTAIVIYDVWTYPP